MTKNANQNKVRGLKKLRKRVKSKTKYSKSVRKAKQCKETGVKCKTESSKSLNKQNRIM